MSELPNLISNRPLPLEVLRHLTPQTKLIDLHILIGIAFSHPFGPKLCKSNHLFCNQLVFTYDVTMYFRIKVKTTMLTPIKTMVAWVLGTIPPLLHTLHSDAF